MKKPVLMVNLPAECLSYRLSLACLPPAVYWLEWWIGEEWKVKRFVKR